MLIHPVIPCENCKQKQSVILWDDETAVCRDCWSDLLGIKHAIELLDSSDPQNTPAATRWIKYDALIGRLFGPNIGEVCLWSIKIEGKRNYFAGHLYQSDNDQTRLAWIGGPTLILDDTVYFARINHLDD